MAIGRGLVGNAGAGDELSAVWFGRLGKDVVDAVAAPVVVAFAHIGVVVGKGPAGIVGMGMVPGVDEFGFVCDVLNGVLVGDFVKVADEDGWEVAGVAGDKGGDFAYGAAAAFLAEGEVGVEKVEGARWGLEFGVEDDALVVVAVVFWVAREGDEAGG